MLPALIKMQTLTLFFVLLISFAYGQDRKISSILNPNCSNCNDYDTLLYVRADGSRDTVHQLWDFTCGIPTVIFIISSLNTTVNMTWDTGAPRKIWLSENPKYSFAIAIDKVLEYDDLDNNGYIGPASPQREFSLANSTWIRDEILQNDQEINLKMKTYYRHHSSHGAIKIKLDLLPFKDFAVELPHLIHTANSTLIDVSLVNLTQSRSYNASRFALHLLMVGTDDSSLSMDYTMRKSLDDEHTPGVFEMIEIRTPGAGGAVGYLQFRPVGYTQPERSVTTSTVAHVSTFNKTKIPGDSTLRTFYRRYNPVDLLVQNMFVSFGEAGDGYYKQHNFTAWSFTVGYGSPPVEGFSPFVIGIISAGLGVPVLLALSGVVYAVVRRCRTHRRLHDDQ